MVFLGGKAGGYSIGTTNVSPKWRQSIKLTRRVEKGGSHFTVGIGVQPSEWRLSTACGQSPSLASLAGFFWSSGESARHQPATCSKQKWNKNNIQAFPKIYPKSRPTPSLFTPRDVESEVTASPPPPGDCSIVKRSRFASPASLINLPGNTLSGMASWTRRRNRLKIWQGWGKRLETQWKRKYKYKNDYCYKGKKYCCAVVIFATRCWGCDFVCLYFI